MKMMIAIPLALAISAAAFAAGGKNRLGDDEIEEGFQKCQQGVPEVIVEKTVETEEGEVTYTVVIDCEENPGPSFP